MSVLVVAAHPDDEILGCGGTLARHAAQGEEVHVLLLAEGVAARDRRRDGAAAETHLAALREAATAAARCIGAQPPRFAGFPDSRMDSLDLLDVVKQIESVIAETTPTIVYTHHGGDLNEDHRLTHQAVLTACRPEPGAPVRAIYTFETVSSSEWSSLMLGEPFLPSRFVDIGDHMDAKMQALECYASEMRPFPHARSYDNVSALARYRGATVGLNATEAFVVLREIVS
jgi:LmbE family N-acetylglucosaminyl deacetylase